MARRSLNSRQRKFVAEYMVDRNGKQAAIRAGYSPRAAEVTASRLLSKGKVAKAVAARSAKIDDRLALTAENVRREYARLAFADASHVMSWGPRGVILKNSDKLSEDDRRAVAEVSETKDGLRLKMHDKKGALDSLAKHMGMFDEIARKTDRAKIPDVINLGDDDSAETVENYADDYTEH